jgi:nucleotide-binding universal stress UspA family protein
MTMLVAYAPDGHGRAVLHLAAMLARSAQDDLVLCAVVPVSWPPSPARVDAEYQEHVHRAAEEALAGARERLPDDVSVTTLVHHARSTPAGLLEVAEEHEASIIVTGSSPAGGSGSVTLGSVTTRLLHSSPIPVALAPRGFRVPAGARVERVTAAFGASGEELVVAAAGVAARVGASLRLASFAVRPRAPFTVAVGREADDSALQEWVAEISAAQQELLGRVADLPSVPADCEAVVGRGESWEDALEDVEWRDGDVLVVGSSAIGPIARVFLGSRSAKIVQHAPVPVVVVPRGVVTELADEAVSAARD